MQTMRDLQVPLTDLDATVQNLRGVSRDIHGEIVGQNRMLDRANADAARTHTRMSRTFRFFERVTQRAKTKWLMLTLVLLLVALIVLAVWVIEVPNPNK